MPNTTTTTVVEGTTTTTTITQNKTIRVCVLTPSYEDSDSATKEWDSIVATPKHFFPEDFVETEEERKEEVEKGEGEAAAGATGNMTRKKVTITITNTRYTFAYVELKKATAYRELRSIIKSNKYDAYFNLCDGAKDEDRAGEEVVRTLEEFNVPFTGAASKYFELSKPDMKMIAHYCGIPTARHAVLDASDLLPVEGGGGGDQTNNNNIRNSSAAAVTMTLPSCGVANGPTSSQPTSGVASDTEGGCTNGNEGDDGDDKAAKAAVVSVTPTLRLEAKCAHLRFPVIVKHVSGYASIGMTQDNKCPTMAALKARVAAFITEFDFALVEEFIVGDEATVLACCNDANADDEAGDANNAAEKIRVYHPVMVNFPAGSDFKHFDLKWSAYEGMEWRPVPKDDPALAQIMEIGRKSFKEMMGGIGYGRCDLRINRERNEVVFLEINPNCGIMYPPGQEGSADYILQMESAQKQKEAYEEAKKAASSSSSPFVVDATKGQRDFAILQIKSAIRRCERTKPLWYRSFDSIRDFHLRASRDIKKGQIVFNDEGRPVRLFTKPYVEATWSAEDKVTFAENAWPIGGGGSNNTNAHYFAVWDINPATWRTFNHSDATNANLEFGPNRSLNVVAARDIKKGEELTMNYELLKNENMPQPKKTQSSAAAAV